MFLFRAFAIGDVFQDVDGTELAAFWIGKRRVGSEKIARQPWIGFVAFARDAFAVGAGFVVHVLARKNLAYFATDERFGLAAEQMAQAIIAAENPRFAIVDENRVADGIEGVRPLLLCIRDLLE